MVELIASDARKSLQFYVLGFKQACNLQPSGCTYGDLQTPAIESGWTQTTLYDETDLTNTVLDCAPCHEPGGPGTTKFLRMQEFDMPWTHWFSPKFEGGMALRDLSGWTDPAAPEIVIRQDMDCLPDRIAELERRAMAEPSSRKVREDLLNAYVEAGLLDSPSRYEHIRWYIRHHPRSLFARSPIVAFQRERAPDAYDAVERVWRAYLDDNPSDDLIARGFAEFIAAAEPARARALLDDFLRAHPSSAEAWVDRGRIEPEPAQRLAFFQRARAEGSTAPNLSAWIAHAAIEAADLAVAERTGQELLNLASAIRQQYGDRVSWSESGRALRAKALATTGSDSEAQTLVRAIANHAYYKHWGHTALGVVAARAGHTEQAVQHLHESVAIGRDPRLSSYGPCFALADALCALARWADVATYLEACAAFWDPEMLKPLRAEVEQGRRPNFPS